MSLPIIRVKFDGIGLSTESKPTNPLDGSTFYEVDTTILYIAYKGTWYKQVPPEPDEEEQNEEQNEEEE